MDILNENLAQLKLMNSRPLSPKTSSTTASSIQSSIAAININNESSVSGNNGIINNSQCSSPYHHKNTGPAVPPKPIKKNPAQIPYSSNIRQTCEPLYSKTLQQQQNDLTGTSSMLVNSGLNSLKPMKISSPIPTGGKIQQNSPRLINQNTKHNNNHHQTHYSNMEMTLDNPAILNQQLEALEYHKKQLEMKGMLPSSSSSPSSSTSVPITNNHKMMNNTKLLVDKFQNEALLQQQKQNNNSSGIVNADEQNSKIIQQQQQNHLYSNNASMKSVTGSKIPSIPQSFSSSPSTSSLSSSGQPSSSSNSGLNLKKSSDVVYSNILHQQQTPQKSNSYLLQNPQNSVVMDNASYPNSVNPNQVYTNINYNSGFAEIPPPSPLELSSGGNSSFVNTLDYSHQPQQLQQQIINEDDLPPPPSPVSSSYSELRRATDNFPQMPVYPLPSVYDNNGDGCLSISSGIVPLSSATDQQTYVNTSFQNDYSTYGPISQDSSTYESIYEPINPRPPSQLSSRSNYSLYTSYVNGIQSGTPGTPIGGISSTIPKVGGINSTRLTSANKEVEVETLTDLLVNSMDSGSDVDSFGICVKCGERVVGENSGCTAMEQIYHISCFTCAVCQINLQGKPFYALEGKPHCEEDYLNTLEKCSVCMKPILERILRATGKPYHPGCFTCIVCGNSLDGIPFTVDATNQNYCIEDFHKKFAPRCCVCKQPIMPEPGQEETVRVVALDRSFHFECYKCEDCGLLLSSEAEGRGCYPLDDHVLCKSCNAKRVQALTNCMTTEL